MPELSTLAEFIALQTAPFQQHGRLSTLNKRMPARATVVDGDAACDIALAATPVSGVTVLVNGIAIPELGDGVMTDCACFFSGDVGATARAWSAIAVGDVLYWNPSVAGFQLETSDVIDFLFEEG